MPHRLLLQSARRPPNLRLARRLAFRPALRHFPTASDPFPDYSSSNPPSDDTSTESSSGYYNCSPPTPIGKGGPGKGRPPGKGGSGKGDDDYGKGGSGKGDDSGKGGSGKGDDSGKEGSGKGDDSGEGGAGKGDDDYGKGGSGKFEDSGKGGSGKGDESGKGGSGKGDGKGKSSGKGDSGIERCGNGNDSGKGKGRRRVKDKQAMTPEAKCAVFRAYVDAVRSARTRSSSRALQQDEDDGGEGGGGEALLPQEEGVELNSFPAAAAADFSNDEFPVSTAKDFCTAFDAVDSFVCPSRSRTRKICSELRPENNPAVRERCCEPIFKGICDEEDRRNCVRRCVQYVARKEGDCCDVSCDGLDGLVGES